MYKGTMILFLTLLGCREPMVPSVETMPAKPVAAWGRVLADVVDPSGDVDYEQLLHRREALDAYVVWIGRRGALAGRKGQQPHAFWLNAFNALTLYQVLERDIQGSVNEVPSALPWDGSRFWFGTEFTVAGESMSLWEIGHERVTHTNQDYRDFAALPLAARSGPPVAPGLYSATELDQQLESQMFALMQSDRGVRVDDAGGIWFNPMFDRYGPEMRTYIHGLDLCTIAALHTTGDKQARLFAASDAGCPHGFFEFDWSLNRSRP